MLLISLQREEGIYKVGGAFHMNKCNAILGVTTSCESKLAIYLTLNSDLADRKSLR